MKQNNVFKNVAGRNIHERELSAVVFQTLPFSVDIIYLYMCVKCRELFLFLNRVFLLFVMYRRLYCFFLFPALKFFYEACVFSEMQCFQCYYDVDEC